MADLKNVIVSMIRHFQRKNSNLVVRQYFELDLEDRQMVKEVFRIARKKYPTKQARTEAKAIYNLLADHMEKEVNLLTYTMEEFLKHWFFSSKEVFMNHYNALGKGEKENMLGALRNVIAKSKNEEFRQAAKDIPVFINSQPA